MGNDDQKYIEHNNVGQLYIKLYLYCMLYGVLTACRSGLSDLKRDAKGEKRKQSNYDICEFEKKYEWYQ